MATPGLRACAVVLVGSGRGPGEERRFEGGQLSQFVRFLVKFNRLFGSGSLIGARER